MMTVMYGVRVIETKVIILRESDEQTAVNIAGRINKKNNDEVVEVVKIVITEEIIEA